MFKSKILNSNFEIKESDSKWNFEPKRDEKGLSFLCELSFDGKNLFSHGVNCSTCGFYLQKTGAVPQLASVLDSQMNEQSVRSLTASQLGLFKNILPTGQFAVSAVEAGVREDVIEGEWHDIGAPYFLLSDDKFSVAGTLEASSTHPTEIKGSVISIIVPTQDMNSLNASRVSQYECRGAEEVSGFGVCYSVLDVRGRGDYDILWVHYLLDGHHKLKAALNAAKPCEFLSFTSIHWSLASGPKIEIFLNDNWRNEEFFLTG